RYVMAAARAVGCGHRLLAPATAANPDPKPKGTPSPAIHTAASLTSSAKGKRFAAFANLWRRPKLIQAAGAGAAHGAIGIGRHCRHRAAIRGLRADHRVIVGRRGAWLERFEDDPVTAPPGPHA